jgi:hypothetical protein
MIGSESAAIISRQPNEDKENFGASARCLLILLRPDQENISGLPFSLVIRTSGRYAYCVRVAVIDESDGFRSGRRRRSSRRKNAAHALSGRRYQERCLVVAMGGTNDVMGDRAGARVPVVGGPRRRCGKCVWGWRAMHRPAHGVVRHHPSFAHSTFRSATIGCDRFDDELAGILPLSFITAVPPVHLMTTREWALGLSMIVGVPTRQ